MEIESAVVDNVTRVNLRGRLDAHGVDEIETRFTASVVPGHRSALVDLSDLLFVSSMGLRMFIVVAKALKRHDAKLILFSPQPQVRGVLASASLSGIILVVDDLGAALDLVSPA